MKEKVDNVLVRHCLSGNRNAFARLVEKYQRPVYNAAFRMLNDPEEARDITQTVFIKAYERLDTFDFNHAFFSWLYRITVNESLNQLKQRNRINHLNEPVPAANPTPEETCRHTEFDRILQDALMDLNPDQRIIIILRHFLNCSYRDLGGILQIPDNTVKSRLFSARQQLKTILIARGITAP